MGLRERGEGCRNAVSILDHSDVIAHSDTVDASCRARWTSATGFGTSAAQVAAHVDQVAQQFAGSRSVPAQ